MRYVRLCEVRCEAPDKDEAAILLVATRGDKALDDYLEVAVAHDEASASGYVDPDGADELARNLAAWAAHRRSLVPVLGPYDEDPDLPLSYVPAPRRVSDEPPRPEALPPLVTAPPDDEGAHEQLRNLGFGTGDADLMLLDLETMESREHWLVVLAMAAKADEEVTRGQG